VTATPVYLNRFFGNLLFGEKNDLNSRELQTDFAPSIRERLDRNKKEIAESEEKKPTEKKKDKGGAER
jgi:hypothetical protein